MHFLQSLLTASLALVQVTQVAGHAKHETAAEQAFRMVHSAKTKRAFNACGANIARRDINDKRLAIRNGLVDSHLESQGLSPDVKLKPRDWVYEGSAANSSCILTPEGEEGPYYVNGSLIRHDIRESQAGIPLILDVQVTDVRTCLPLSGLAIDFWSANTTGVYSGEESENTVGETYLRGIQITDDHGLVQVMTNIPGWYQGRAQHIHVRAHVNYTKYDNDTISFGDIPHTGQMFFQQSTLSQVNTVYPYTLDTNTVTLNTADQVIQGQQNTSYYDGFIEMRSMGYNISTGFVGFINMAIDPTATPAAAGRSGGGGMGGGAGNGTMGGAMPSGAMSSGTGAPPSGAAATAIAAVTASASSSAVVARSFMKHFFA